MPDNPAMAGVFRQHRLSGSSSSRRSREKTVMDALNLSHIRSNPKFIELERKRNAFSWSLAVVMIVIYAIFIGLVAFDHSFLAEPIGAGPITLAFPLGLGVIAAAIILTGVYVVRANSEFDRLTREIVGQEDARALPVGAGVLGGVR
jgi:uncharacterized membrane protein (DUF485 family)